MPEEWHQLIECRRCKRNTLRPYWFQLIHYRIAGAFLWLANKAYGEKPGWEPYHYVNNIEYIARSHLQGLVDQGDDELLSDYLSGKNWVRLSDLKHEDSTPYTGEEQTDLINRSLTLEATRQEQNKLNEYVEEQPQK